MQDVLLRDAGGEVRDELAELRGRHPSFAELLVTDDGGTVVAATRPENVGKDLSAEAAVAEARAGGRYQGTVGPSGLAPGTVLAMAAPVRAKYDGTTVVGVLLGLVDWDQVRRELAAVPLAGAAQDAGHLLELRSRADGSLLYGTAAAAPSGRDGFLVRAAASGARGALADPGWEMGALVAGDVAFTRADRLRDQVVWLGALACAPALAGCLAAGHVARPLTRMIGAMDRLAGGDTETPVPELGRSDEIGGMAAALEVFRETARDRARKEARIEHLAHHDALTGLANRALFRERLGRALAAARRRGGPVAVLCLDLDRFKPVNDTLGHPVGDALLRAVAARLLACVREGDTAARLGGDEFAVLQAGAGQPEAAGALARRLVEALSAPYEVLGHQVVVGASVGVALAPGDGRDPDELLKRADMALYRAKADGARHLPQLRARHGRPAPGAPAARARPAEGARGGRAGAALPAAGRPADGRGERARGAAALAPPGARPGAAGRVHAAGGGDRADRAGRRVGAAARLRRRGRLARGRAGGGQPVGGAVPRPRAGGGGGRRAGRGGAGAGAARARDHRDGAAARRRGDAGHPAGAAGAGGADRDGRLRHRLLDRSATCAASRSTRSRSTAASCATCGASADCEAIVRAVTGLGGSLGIATTAEGVETEEQLERLRAEGCDEAQGFHLGRPMPAADVRALLDRGDARQRPAAA